MRWHGLTIGGTGVNNEVAGSNSEMMAGINRERHNSIVE